LLHVNFTTLPLLSSAGRMMSFEGAFCKGYRIGNAG
jgi:hypothetical protein